MSGGIFIHFCPCCFADGVMITAIPPFLFADGEDVVPLSHLLTAVTTGLYIFHQQLSILTAHESIVTFQLCREHVCYHFCWWMGKGNGGVAHTDCHVQCCACWHMEILHMCSIDVTVNVPPCSACPWSPPLMCYKRATLCSRLCMCPL